MRNHIYIDGYDLANFGVYISGTGVFNAPVRALNMVSIPGRNSDIIINGYDYRFNNISVAYPAFIYSNFRQNLAQLRAFLLRAPARYRRITDTYNPNEFRMGVYTGGLDVTPTSRLEAGRFDLVFNCQPQRFLTLGETVQVFTANGTINNPGFSQGPLLRVYGAGTVGIGAGSLTISQADVYTDIDCDLQIAYKGSVSKNQYVSSATPNFPYFGPGDNGVTLGTGITRVEITPRWWTV